MVEQKEQGFVRSKEVKKKEVEAKVEESEQKE